jgi:uncharacterized protein YdeI (YjbR/CyaY-like superfamily)
VAKPLYFGSTAEFRAWLETRHDQARELMVGFHKKGTGEPGITYHEALDEALCFGWIDGVRKSIDARRYTIRFTPRKPKSYWSAVNVHRALALQSQGRMAPAGVRAFEARDAQAARRYSFESRPRELPASLARRFRASKVAWTFFRAQAPHYQRAAIWWVISARKEETRVRRLDALMDHSAKGHWLPQMPAAPKGRKPR